jgi:hypothetical protein
MFVVYLFVFDIVKILKIEAKLEKKFKADKTLTSNNNIKNLAIFEDPKINERNFVKGKYIRISSVFNEEKKEVCELLNNFSVYGLVDQKIKIAEAENYYNQLNSNRTNDNHIKTEYYSIVYKNKNCYSWGRGKIDNKQMSIF